MQLTVSGQNVEVTEALRDYVGKKLNRIERHANDVVEVQVVLSVEKFRHFAEINVATGGAHFHAATEAKDMYAAIDAMADKIDRQIRRHKEKFKENQTRESRSGGIQSS